MVTKTKQAGILSITLILLELFSNLLDGRSLLKSFLDERSVLLGKMGMFDCLRLIRLNNHLGFLPGNP